MSDLVERLRAHVNNRGGASLQNGAWQMMLDAADEIERLRAAVLRIDAINDNPARFSFEINNVCNTILRPLLVPPVASEDRA